MSQGVNSNSSVNNNYGAIAGTAIGGGLSGIGIYKTNKTLKPVKNAINNIEQEVVEPIRKIQDYFKNSEAQSLPIAQEIKRNLNKNLTRENIQKEGQALLDAYIADLAKSNPELSKSYATLKQAAANVDKIAQNLKAIPKEDFKIIKDSALLAPQDILDMAAKLSKEDFAKFVDTKYPNLSDRAKTALTTSFDNAKAVLDNLEQNKAAAEQIVTAVKEQKSNLAAILTREEAKKGTATLGYVKETLPNTYAEATEAVKAIVGESQQSLKQIQEDTKAVVANAGKAATGAYNILTPVVQKAKEAFNNQEAKDVVSVMSKACETAKKTTNKYFRVLVLGSMALIPAGFGIGTLVDKGMEKYNQKKIDKQA